VLATILPLAPIRATIAEQQSPANRRQILSSGTHKMSRDLVNIGEVIVHGVLFDPKNTEAWKNMDVVENIFHSVPRLFDLLEERKVEYVLVGGIAMLAFIDGRNTQDIDVILARADLQKLPEIRIEDENKDFARGWLGDLRVDFLFSEGKLFREVQLRYSAIKQFADRRVPCATVEGLLLMKLAALPDKYRRAHFDRVRTYEKDVADLIERYKPATPPVLAELAKHVLSSDMDEIRKIVADIEDRIAKQSERFGGGKE
jgi:hypothetical protein